MQSSIALSVENLRSCNRATFIISAGLRVGSVSPLEMSSLVTSQESCSPSSVSGLFSFAAQLIIPDMRNMSIVSTDSSVLVVSVKTLEQSVIITQPIVVSARSFPIPGTFFVIEKGDVLVRGHIKV